MKLATANAFMKAVPVKREGRDFPSRQLKVRDIMISEEMKIFSTDTLDQVKHIMEWEGLNHCCVFDKKANFLGLIDLEQIKKYEKHGSLENMTAGDLCHQATHVLFGSMEAREGVLTVVSDKYHSCPVFENGAVVGILNIEDIYAPSEFN